MSTKHPGVTTSSPEEEGQSITPKPSAKAQSLYHGPVRAKNEKAYRSREYATPAAAEGVQAYPERADGQIGAQSQSRQKAENTSGKSLASTLTPSTTNEQHDDVRYGGQSAHLRRIP